MIIYESPEDRVAARGVFGVSPPLPFLVRNRICAPLVTAFCPHFPKLHRSISLEMIKIASTVSLYCHPTLPFEIPSCVLEETLDFDVLESFSVRLRNGA